MTGRTFVLLQLLRHPLLLVHVVQHHLLRMTMHHHLSHERIDDRSRPFHIRNGFEVSRGRLEAGKELLDVVVCAAQVGGLSARRHES